MLHPVVRCPMCGEAVWTDRPRREVCGAILGFTVPGTGVHPVVLSSRGARSTTAPPPARPEGDEDTESDAEDGGPPSVALSGRRKLIDRIHAVLHKALAAGRPAAALLHGPSGAGKSALLAASAGAIAASTNAVRLDVRLPPAFGSRWPDRTAMSAGRERIDRPARRDVAAAARRGCASWRRPLTAGLTERESRLGVLGGVRGKWRRAARTSCAARPYSTLSRAPCAWSPPERPARHGRRRRPRHRRRISSPASYGASATRWPAHDRSEVDAATAFSSGSHRGRSRFREDLAELLQGTLGATPSRDLLADPPPVVGSAWPRWTSCVARAVRRPPGGRIAHVTTAVESGWGRTRGSGGGVLGESEHTGPSRPAGGGGDGGRAVGRGDRGAGARAARGDHAGREPGGATRRGADADPRPPVGPLPHGVPHAPGGERVRRRRGVRLRAGGPGRVRHRHTVGGGARAAAPGRRALAGGPRRRQAGLPGDDRGALRRRRGAGTGGATLRRRRGRGARPHAVRPGRDPVPPPARPPGRGGPPAAGGDAARSGDGARGDGPLRRGRGVVPPDAAPRLGAGHPGQARRRPVQAGPGQPRARRLRRCPARPGRGAAPLPAVRRPGRRRRRPRRPRLPALSARRVRGGAPVPPRGARAATRAAGPPRHRPVAPPPGAARPRRLLDRATTKTQEALRLGEARRQGGAGAGDECSACWPSTAATCPARWAT